MRAVIEGPGNEQREIEIDTDALNPRFKDPVLMRRLLDDDYGPPKPPRPPEPRCLACCDVEDWTLEAYGGCRCCGRRYDAEIAEPIDRELRRTGRTLGTIIADMFRHWRGLRESWE